MKSLTHTSTSDVYHSLKGSKNPRSRYCLTISGRVSVGDFMCMAPSAMAPSATPIDEDCGSITSKMLGRFRSNKIFGQVTKIYNKQKNGDDVEDEGDVLFDINLTNSRTLATYSLIGMSNVVTVFLAQVTKIGDFFRIATTIHTQLTALHILRFEHTERFPSKFRNPDIP
jgi:hypothetical protein